MKKYPWIIIPVLLCACNVQKETDVPEVSESTSSVTVTEISVADTVMTQESSVVSEITSSVTETVAEPAQSAVDTVSQTAEEETTAGRKIGTDMISSDREGILFLSDDIEVEIYPPRSPHIISNGIWTARDRQQFREGVSAVVKAEVVDRVEVGIRYYFGDTRLTSDETLYKLKIEENLWREADSSEVIVAAPDSSYGDCEDMPDLKPGDKAVFFLRDIPERMNDLLDMQSYADHYVSSPADIAVFEGEDIIVDGIFAQINDRYYTPHNDRELLEGEIVFEEDPMVESVPLYTDTAQVIIPEEEFYSRLFDIMNEQKPAR